MEPAPRSDIDDGRVPSSTGLWARIRAHPFESSDGSLNFTAKFMRLHGCTRDEARAAIDEYRKFCFLAVVVGREMVPSEIVDQVWHLHLTYTRDYWTVFCPSVLGCDLHHEPSRGRTGDAVRFHENYADTLAAYAEHFGPPPEKYWPGTRERFRRSTMQWIDRNRFFVVPRLRLLTRREMMMAIVVLMALATTTAVRASSPNPLEWVGPDFLVFFGTLAIACFIVMAVWQRSLRDNGSSGNATALDTWHIAYLAGGRDRVVDAAVSKLMSDSAIVWNAKEKRLKSTPSAAAPSDPLLERVFRHIQIDGRPRQLAKRMRPELARMHATLETRGLLMDGTTRSRAVWIPLALPAALIAFGLAKLFIGLSRDKPVAFLGFLLVACVVISFLIAARTGARSRAGDTALALLTERHAHTARAPRLDDLPLAVALIGTSALSTTAFASYHQARQSNAGDSSSSGSSCGSDGGGGGCGGCGGGD
jgi:uncharacterized protein (TIGR04222 family)